jgi:hypothetical protein
MLGKNYNNYRNSIRQSFRGFLRNFSTHFGSSGTMWLVCRCKLTERIGAHEMLARITRNAVWQCFRLSRRNFHTGLASAGTLTPLPKSPGPHAKATSRIAGNNTRNLGATRSLAASTMTDATVLPAQRRRANRRPAITLSMNGPRRHHGPASRRLIEREPRWMAQVGSGVKY